ncbi:hypothetical protein OX284_001835 [Flavobacterium sp. SUN046]|uniref:hypothetical protein n=1 Tax=Flavobacterium sp. SUN046 TaxID=3002440 RepID=UPI002DBFA445|nr:hypothetical protein [Flavobacterium sp. SUN046]MEC4048156.1 hypothetical protein [Flavobacterium sp. SUN046]
MKTLINIKLGLYSLVLLTSSVAMAQQYVPFSIRYQSFVKGDMVVIANNIVNRVDYNDSPNDPYYNHTPSALVNDEFTMEYIDIDQDTTTFSSSSAELLLDNQNNKKVLYAGLYWAATYKYNSGVQKKENKFTALDEDRETFNDVKIKFPNQVSYTDIIGQVIFDGIKDNDISDQAPYAVYADITEYVKNLDNPSGVYTVANVKATQGMLSGGVAAGWTIIIVYEDLKLSGKMITSYDGFSGVSKEATDLFLDGFTTPSQGQVKAKIACAALEGDSNYGGDQLLFSSTTEEEFTPIYNTIRKADNFFNSAISIENQFFMDRYPDSKNTLGYDTCMMSIPNLNNKVLENNVQEATLRIQSTGDKYFMFFSAFGVEMTPAAVTSEIEIANNKNVITPPKETIMSNVKLVPASNDMVTDIAKPISSQRLKDKEAILDPNKNEKPIEIQTITVANQDRGYYLVAGVYSDTRNAYNFVTQLLIKGLDPKSFINPLNRYEYVYLTKVASEKEAIDLFQSKLNNSYKDKIWILSVNNSSNMNIATED